MVCALLAGCTSPHAQVEPSIEFTHLPPAGEGSPSKLEGIEGRVVNHQPGQRIVLYARSGRWWVQPFVNQPFTTVWPDSTWKSSTHPGSAYAALLVQPGYQPPPTADALPEKGGPIVALASVEGRKLAAPSSRTLQFSGYEWRMRETPSDPGGTHNDYDSANAWTDDRGYLHMRIAGTPGRWTCAEVNLTRSLGYGSYSFRVRDVSQLEASAVFTMLTWDDTGPQREMDMEISRWGEPTAKNAQFVVQPYHVPANSVRFLAPAGPVTYVLNWEPGRASFQATRGPSQIIAQHAFTSGIPSPGNESIHMNLYVFGNRNPLRHGTEVIVEKFEYLP